MNTRTKVIIAAIISIVLYTAAALFIQYKTNSEVSSTLTDKWFDFWTIELAVLAGITIAKTFKGEE